LDTKIRKSATQSAQAGILGSGMANLSRVRS